MESFQRRVDCGIAYHYEKLPPVHRSLDGVPEDVTTLRFWRERSSHRGFERLQRLEWLYAAEVNPEFLTEIVRIPSLQTLFIHNTTVVDFRPLGALRNLRRLHVQGGTKPLDLDWVSVLPPLEVLDLDNFKRVSDLTPLAQLTSLRALAVEGAIWSRMRVDSLAPLAKLRNLRSLFLISLRTRDGSLEPLHALDGLEELQCANYYGDEQFRRLRKALPKLNCDWFDALDRHGSVKAAIRSLVATNKPDWLEPPPG